MTVISDRKDSHLDLALKSQVSINQQDLRFDYEPLCSGLPTDWKIPQVFLGKQINLPLWISSMTGGSKNGGEINRLLASAAAKYSIGLGLGSCRILLEDKRHFNDFNLRPLLGGHLPFYANLGIAQVETLLLNNKLDDLQNLCERLDTDGLIVHVNPLQEFFQNEGDHIIRPPFETLQELSERFEKPLIIKEVGQGMGPRSLEKLCELAIAGLELAAFGGTNFTKLEGEREKKLGSEIFSKVGHSADQMIDILNRLNLKGTEIIISGGINSVLDAYYLKSKCGHPAVLGMAGQFLKYANKGEKSLYGFIEQWAYQYKLASNYLRVKQ